MNKRDQSSPPLPVVLTIAGFDSCGGAGVPADLFAIAHHGCYAVAALTSLVTQSSRQVADIQPFSAASLTQQIEFLLSQYQVSAIKIGLLPNSQLIEACAEALSRHLETGHLDSKVPIILDPVITASAGAQLMDAQALPTLRHKLLPLCTLITPNWDEAQALKPLAQAPKAPPTQTQTQTQTQTHNQTITPTLDQATSEELDAYSLSLAQELPCDLLLKGGHSNSDQLTDRLVTQDGIQHFHGQKIPTQASHGTGCRLSAALAALLARGEPLPEAVRQAKQFVSQCLQQSIRLKTPKTAAQGDHFHLNLLPKSNA